MSRSLYIPVALGMVAIGMVSAAMAAPRGASSKIRGDYSFDSGAGRASTVYRAPASMNVRSVPGVPRSAPQVARTETDRRFSHESAAKAPETAPCEAAVTGAAPSGRRFSYEPGMTGGTAVRRYSAPQTTRGFAPNRDAGFKIRGDY